jgi:uridine kinase
LPDYDYRTCKRKQPGIIRKWAPLIIFEGIFAILQAEINVMLDFKIFVHTDDDVRLSRRIKRDIVERGRKIEGVLKSYHKFVKPAHNEFIKPSMRYADLIVPRSRPMESPKN